MNTCGDQSPPLVWRVVRYAVPVDPPLPVPGGTIAKRCGWLLKATRPDGATGWGEAAPLDGYSPDTQAEVGAALARWHARPDGDPARLPPSLRCAIEEALADLGDRPPPPPVPLARLLAGRDREALETAAAAAVDQGFRAVKIKVGRGCPSEEAAWVRAIGRRLPETVAVRLDANRAWAFDDAVTFLAGVDIERITLIEEPLRDPAGLSALTRCTGCPVALDETLTGIAPDALDRFGPLAALVLKPMALGGWSVCDAWRREAVRRGCPVVVSAMHETGVGLRAWMHRWHALAADERQPAGLDTAASLADDVWLPRLRIEAGALCDPAATRGEYRLHTVFTQEVA